MDRNYIKILAGLFLLILFGTITIIYIKKTGTAENTGGEAQQLPPPGPLEFSGNTLTTYFNDTYNTKINENLFLDVQSMYCGQAVASKTLMVDCVGRQGETVFVFGHADKGVDKTELQNNMANFLAENFILTPGTKYGLRCNENYELKTATSSVHECFVTTESVVEGESEQEVVSQLSLMYFNLEAETIQYVFITPKTEPSFFKDLFLTPEEKVSWFKFINVAYAGGDAGEGGGAGVYHDNIGMAIANAGPTAAAAAGYHGSNGSVSGNVYSGDLSAALASGMVMTGNNVACCNSFGDAVSGINSGDGGGGWSGPWNPGTGTAIVPVNAPLLCPGGEQFSSVTTQYACHVAAHTVSTYHSDWSVPESQSAWQNTFPADSCVYISSNGQSLGSILYQYVHTCPTPVNAVCAAPRNTCTSGTASSTGESSTEWLWSCNGIAGGTDVLCSETKPDEPGVCGVPQNTCDAGNLGATGGDSYYWYWGCFGTGSNASSSACSYAKPVAGVPTNLAGTCNGMTGTSATLSWTTPVNTDSYYIRITFPLAQSCPTGWQRSGAECFPNPDTYVGNSFTFTTEPYTTYPWWIHGKNQHNYSAAIGSTVTCTPVTNLVSQNFTTSAAPFPINVPLTLTAQVRNAGPANAVAFSDNFTYQMGGTSGVWLPISTIAHAAGLASGATVTDGPISFTPTQAGALYVQHCVDTLNQVSEAGDETPNCTVLGPITVSPVPTLTFTATPTVVNPTSPTVLSWTVTDATACTATNGWTGSKTATNGTHTESVTPTATTTYLLTCTGPGGTVGPVGPTVGVNPPLVTFTATPALIGPGSTSTLAWSTVGATTCTGSGGTGWAGNKAVPNGSEGKSPSITTTYDISCTGPSGITNRSVTVTLPSGSISATACEIPAGGASCNSTVSWNSANFLGARSILQQGVEFSTAASNGGTVRSATPITNTFTLRDAGSAFIRDIVANVNCHVSSVWVTPLSVCLLLPVIDIQADPNIVRSGEIAPVEIIIEANYALGCTVTGGLTQTFNHTASLSPQTYNFTTNPLTAAQVVTISCVSPLYANVNGSDEVRVSVIPTIQEI